MQIFQCKQCILSTHPRAVFERFSPIDEEERNQIYIKIAESIFDKLVCAPKITEEILSKNGHVKKFINAILSTVCSLHVLYIAFCRLTCNTK